MSNGNNGYRWSKFWWQDWSSDPALAVCSLAAQGLWMRLLCIMHEAVPRGFLLLNGKPPTAEQIATITRAGLPEIAQLLRELREAGVYSRDASGVIFSRRMVRDTAASDAGKRSGKMGGNPVLGRRSSEQNPINGVDPDIHDKGVNPLKLEAEAEEEAEGTPPCIPPLGEQGGEARLRRATRTLIPPDWEPNHVSMAKALNLGLSLGDVSLVAEQMRAWAKAGDQRKADWHSMFDRFVLQEFSSRAAERRRAKAPSATAEIRAAVGTLLTIDLEDDENLPVSSKAMLQ